MKQCWISQEMNDKKDKQIVTVESLTMRLRILSNQPGLLILTQDDLRSLLRESADQIELLAEKLLNSGAFNEPPCFLCGYDGEGYYQSATHHCAAKYQAARSKNAISVYDEY